MDALWEATRIHGRYTRHTHTLAHNRWHFRNTMKASTCAHDRKILHSGRLVRWCGCLAGCPRDGEYMLILCWKCVRILWQYVFVWAQNFSDICARIWRSRRASSFTVYAQTHTFMFSIKCHVRLSHIRPSGMWIQRNYSREFICESLQTIFLWVLWRRNGIQLWWQRVRDKPMWQCHDLMPFLIGQFNEAMVKRCSLLVAIFIRQHHQLMSGEIINSNWIALIAMTIQRRMSLRKRFEYSKMAPEG